MYSMDYVHYAKIWFSDFQEPVGMKSVEVFLIANNYAEAATKIEEAFKETLISYQIYAIDADMVYVEDIQVYLDEAREMFSK